MTTKIPAELSSTPGIVDNSDATAITIDSSENVGIGTTSPTSALHVVGGASLGSGFTQTRSGHPSFGITNGNTDTVYFSIAPDGGSHQSFMEVVDDDTDVDSIKLKTSGSEAVRFTSGGALSKTRTSVGTILGHNIDWNGSNYSNINTSYGSKFIQMASNAVHFRRTASGSGNQSASYDMTINSAGALLVGTTTHTNNSSGNETVAEFVYDHYSRGVEIRSTVGGSNQPFLGFRYGGGPTDCGGIRRDAGSQTPEFFSGSDRRIKTNIQDMDDTLSKICQMPLVKYDLKDSTGSGVGVLAQDLIDIFPEKVTTTDDGKGETLPDGVEAWTVGHNYTYQILKAIQEQQAIIEDLKSRIETLEG